MENERAIEILDPEHREAYESLEPVNEACRMGVEALRRRVPESPYPDGDAGVLACPSCGSGEYLHNDVIAHIMSHFTGLTEEPVEVLSMYDGMSCGHIALDKLGAEITAYYATEIDKYAIQTTQHNFPDTVQLGDAFQVRDEEWRPRRAEEAE